LPMDWNEISTLYRGQPINVSYHVSASPLKQHGQMNRNLVGSIYGRSSIKNAHYVPIHEQT
jgi:hypothetical protein